MSRMEINEIRRRNLRTLLDAYLADGGKKKDFAELIGVEAPQLTHVTSEPASRNIGDRVARRIEENLNLARGWLDVAQSQQPTAQSDSSRSKFILNQLSSNTNTGQAYSGGFNLIKLSDSDFIGDVKLMDSYSSVINQIDVDEEYARSMFGGRDSSALRIYTSHGDSMLPTVDPGEVVVLDITVHEVVSDGIYLFEFGGDIHLKRLQRIRHDLGVISDNKAYDNWVISDDERQDLHIIGFLIGKFDMTYTRLG